MNASKMKRIPSLLRNATTINGNHTRQTRSLSSSLSLSSSPKQRQRRIVVALSGGVDSSVAAYLIRSRLGLWRQQQQQQQLQLVAVHMSNWNTSDEDDVYCTNDMDWKDAQAVARHLQIPLHPTSFAADFWTQVFQPFVTGVEQGRRPNPDVHCNRYIKFGALREFVSQKLQADYLVTGHYARLWHRHHHHRHHHDYYSNDDDDNDTAGGWWLPNDDNLLLIEQLLQEDPNPPEWIRSWGHRTHSTATLPPLLLAAKDRSKCQSFFLSSVPGECFRNVIFPLGDYCKTKSSNNNNNETNTATATVSDKQTTTTTAATTTTTSVTDMSSLTVREIAEMAQLPTAHKKDSMGICFIGKRPGGFTDFIDQYFTIEEDHPHQHKQKQQSSSTTTSNNNNNNAYYQFVDVDTGEIVQNEFGNSTTHHMVYTRGQRAKISGASKAWFVVQTDRQTRSIIVCQGTHHPALYTNVFYVVKDLSWTAGDLPTPLQQTMATTTVAMSSTTTRSSTGSTTHHHQQQQPPMLQALCRVRNLQPLVRCQITYQVESGCYQVRTQKPLRAITPGQHCAIYVGKDGLVCLGGGTILEPGPSYHELNMSLNTVDLHPAGHNDLSVMTRQLQQHL